MDKTARLLENQELRVDGATDARLVENVRAGDPEAFGVLVTRYEKKLVRVIGRLVHDRELALDLAQETFLRAYKRLDQFDSSRRFAPWLFQIGVNLCVDHLRRRRRGWLSVFTDAEKDGKYEAVSPDPRPHEELSQEVRYVLEQIPLKYRTVLVLRDLEGFSCSEVAAIAGRQEATIRWRLSRARDMFRRLWLERNRSKEVG